MPLDGVPEQEPGGRPVCGRGGGDEGQAEGQGAQGGAGGVPQALRAAPRQVPRLGRVLRPGRQTARGRHAGANPTTLQPYNPRTLGNLNPTIPPRR
eukprot:1178098-Prorocentrum_minimum.AAC.2